MAAVAAGGYGPKSQQQERRERQASQEAEIRGRGREDPRQEVKDEGKVVSREEAALFSCFVEVDLKKKMFC